MENQITIREAVTENDVAAFWEQLHAYHKRDIFTDSDKEELEYFLGSEYHDQMMKIYGRPQDHCFFLFFHRGWTGHRLCYAGDLQHGGRQVLYHGVLRLPGVPGSGTGKACARTLLDWAKEHGARYAELNYGGNDWRRHFWESVGFIENGADEWGEPLMLLPPEEDAPITVELLADPDDWQLKKLENGFLKEIGEAPSTEEKQEQLAQAIRDGKITFFVAKRGYRAVGMCSISRCFSTFACTDVGIFDDFYLEPAFRKKGAAWLLAQAAQEWSKENALASLTVTCAPCDEGMYQALGFDTHLGNTFAYLR